MITSWLTWSCFRNRVVGLAEKGTVKWLSQFSLLDAFWGNEGKSLHFPEESFAFSLILGYIYRIT